MIIGDKIQVFKSDADYIASAPNLTYSVGNKIRAYHVDNIAYGNRIPWRGKFRKIVCGNDHTLILLNDGTVWSCGSNTYKQLGHDNTVPGTFQQVPITEKCIDIATGDYHSIILTEYGYTYVCGDNTFGQLGIITTQTFSPLVLRNDLLNVRQVHAGSYTSYFVTNLESMFQFDGSVGDCPSIIMHGKNDKYQLGDASASGTNTAPNTVTIMAFGQMSIKSFMYPIGMVCFAKKDIFIRAFVLAQGYNSYVAHNPLEDLSTIEYFTEFQCQGDNQYGQLLTTVRNDIDNPASYGTGSFTTSSETGEYLAIENIYSSGDHTIFQFTNGNIWYAGLNDEGQLFDSEVSDYLNPNTRYISSPCDIFGLNEKYTIGIGREKYFNVGDFNNTQNIQTIPTWGSIVACGTGFTMTVVDGYLYSSGLNDKGQLGRSGSANTALVSGWY